MKRGFVTERHIRIRCRFCEWTCELWRTTPSGKRVTGWNKLAKHVFEDHPEDYDVIQRWLDDGKAEAHA